MKYVIAFLALFAWSTSGTAQDVIHTTDGVFFCHGDHPRCSWPDQSTYPYYQFSGQHLGQMSGVSDILPDGPSLPQYQSWLTELISLRPGTNAVASWSDAESKVNGGLVWGSFISARSELPDGADSQLIGLEIDVLNDGLPGVYPNMSKVGLQIVGFGQANTNAIEVLTQTPSAAFQNIINIQPNSIAPDGAVIGMAPQHAGRGIDFRGSTFTDGAFLLSPNQKIVFRIPGLNDAAIYRDQFSNGYLVLQAGTPGLRITNAQDTANLMIITPDGNFITPLGSFANVLSRLSSLEAKSGASLGAVPASTAQEPADVPGPDVGVTPTGTVVAAATGPDSTASGAKAVASGARSVALGNSSTASAQQATAVGNGAQANAVSTVALGSNAQATSAGSTAIGDGAQASGSNSVAIGANSTDGGVANVVSVGSSSQTRRLTNVADGVSVNDGVNLGQLNDSLSRAAASAQAYTDQRFNELSYDLSNVRTDLHAVRRDAEGATASAMALAGIPQTIEPGKGMIGLGLGTWEGQSAFAVGISKATDDGRFVLKAGATYNSRSQGGANAGVGWAF